MPNEHTKNRLQRVLDKHRLPENVAARFAQSPGFKAMAQNLAINAMAKVLIDFLKKKPGRKVILESTADDINVTFLNEKGELAEPDEL